MRIVAIAIALIGCGSTPMTRLDGGARDAGHTTPPVDGGTLETATIHFVGRFDRTDPDAPRFAWPGSAILARFEGTEISVDLDGGNNQFEVVVDGVAQPVLDASGRQTYSLASGLAPGQHDLALVRRTESFFGVSQFFGFAGAQLVASPAPARLIEMIGDSITCGYGALGVGPGCGFSADTEAETHAWGAFVAQSLGAVNTAIAYSGRGVYQNLDGNRDGVLPQLFERTFADDPASAWTFDYQPDVVVVDLGTNDFGAPGGDPGAAFADAYSDFVRQIRGRYPDAWILIANSPMLAGADHDALGMHLDEVVRTVADDRVAAVDIDTQDGTAGYGCDYHPSEAQHRRMAAQLETRIRGLTGW